MTNLGRAARRASGWVLGSVFAVLTVPTAAHALHGAAIQKVCLGPGNTAKARPGDTITCSIKITNTDTFGDMLRVDSITDVINNLGGPTTTANLLTDPCAILPPGASITVSHQFMAGNPENDPLTDNAHAAGADLRNAGQPIDPGCPTPAGAAAFTLSFGAMVDIVECFTDDDCNDHKLCTVDTCDLNTNACVFTPGNAGTVCRSSAGVCDTPELCTGTSADCPPDTKSTAVCRSAAGVCDIPETCDGIGNDCPPDVLSSSATVCRAAAGVCDIAELCTGSSAACPSDMKSSAVCRSSAGVCDVPESCNGTTNDCPPDAFSSSAVVCRSAAGVCDVAENCTGSAAACPPDAKSSAVCRSAAGVCDTPESCNGTSNDCPADTFAGSAVVCRSAAGVCDVAEHCTGTSGDCPGDTLQSSGTVCRAAAGVCDVAESCTGSSATCPPDMKSTAVCRSAAGVCDVPESCSGTSNTCPPDAFTGSTVVCRSSAGVCDTAELCTGSGPSCPPDGFSSSSVVCRSANGQCDVAEHCPGNGPACPGDGKQPSGTSCSDDGNPCTLDQCDGTTNTCTHPPGHAGVVCRSGSGVCNPPEVCTGTSSTCPADAFAAAGTPCDDTDNRTCTTAECDGSGTCDQEAVNNCGGCRVTAGGTLTDPSPIADVNRATFGGQVGAPCGCIGCFDEFGHIQGNWQYSRKQHNGTLHAKTYNSLVCGCDGVLTGQVCEGDGPAPPPAPANEVCFSGVADFALNNGKKTTDVAFRVEAEDRGEPGSNDKYRIRVWIPTTAESADDLASKACCTNTTPAIRTPDIDDGGTLAGGNIQIHRELDASANGTCPVPHGVCTQ